MTDDPAQQLLAALDRDRSFLSDANRRLSFIDLSAAVTQVVGALDRLRIAADDGVALQCDNDVPSVVVLLALLASGRSFVLLRPPGPSDVGSDQDAFPEAFCRYRLRFRNDDDAAAAMGEVGFTAFDRPVRMTANEKWHRVAAAETACLYLPTSGSTGRAKLVRHRQRLLFPAARNFADRIALTPDDRVAIPVPIAHMYGLGAALLPSLLAGASIDLQSNANPLRYLARERAFDPTVTFLTPSFGDSLIRLRRVRRELRLTVMAGDQLPGDLFDRYELTCGRLVNLYGSSELGATAVGSPDDPAEVRRDLIGRLLAGVKILPDPGTMQTAGTGVLWFEHAYGFDCYVDAAGSAIADADGTLASGRRFRSNDVGRLVGGHLEILGRNDDLVNRDGLLVACATVAAAIRTIGGIDDVAVLAGGMARRGRALVAFCAPASDAQWEPGSLRRACLDVLPARAVPDEILLVPHLPLLPNGKIDRQELRRRIATGV